jgi:hypothetical protein
VVGQGGYAVFKGGVRAAVRGPQADPSQPVARRGRREREEPGPVQGPAQVAALHHFLSHHLRLPDAASHGHRRIVLRSSCFTAGRGTPRPRASRSPPWSDAWGAGPARNDNGEESKVHASTPAARQPGTARSPMAQWKYASY